MRPIDLVSAATTTGVAVAGVALLDMAIVPGLVVGAAAVLVPRYLPRRFFSNWRRRSRPARDVTRSKLEAPRAPVPIRHLLPTTLADLAHVQFSQALVKTVTFRIIVTSLDFTANFLVLGELGVAAGLSAISLVGGPLVYFLHESTWNYLSSSGRLELVSRQIALPSRRALVKTITYRVVATTIEFTTNYVVVRDLGTAALLSSFGFVLGPFVYYGHERAWERFGPANKTLNPKWGPVASLDRLHGDPDDRSPAGPPKRYRFHTKQDH